MPNIWLFCSRVYVHKYFVCMYALCACLPSPGVSGTSVMESHELPRGFWE